jgi:23S rRNA (pseudouridine1915-N3)-methyltransferase
VQIYGCIRNYQNFFFAIANWAYIAPVNLQIWTIGKEHEPHFREAIALYLKKTQPYVKVEFVVIASPKKGAGQPADKLKALEGETIRARLKPGMHLIVLDERGKAHTSEEWAQHFGRLRDAGTGTLVLLIGGAFGVSEDLREEAKAVWSLSKLVFPHQLVRLIVAEQVYRAFSILHGSGYHHS